MTPGICLNGGHLRYLDLRRSSTSPSARKQDQDWHRLWRLAAHWYDWRMDRGYIPREPAQAAD